MQSSGSQMGISRAMARFSYFVVPVRNDPSLGNALTGSLSPSPAISGTVTRRTNSGASSGTVMPAGIREVASAGTATSSSASSARSTAARLRSTTVRPRLPYVFCTDSLMRARASSAGSTPARAKKQGCMTVLMRLPMPTSAAMRSASITQKRRRLSMIWRCTHSGRWSHTSSAGKGLLSRKVPPALTCPSTVILPSSPNWWQPTKSASSIR